MAVVLAGCGDHRAMNTGLVQSVCHVLSISRACIPPEQLVWTGVALAAALKS